MSQQLQLSLLLTAQAGQLVGQVRSAREEVARLGAASTEASKGAGTVERATTSQAAAARKLEQTLRPTAQAAAALRSSQSALPASMTTATVAIDGQAKALERLAQARQRGVARGSPGISAPTVGVGASGLAQTGAEALGLGQALGGAASAGAWLLGGGAAIAATRFGFAIAEAGDKARNLQGSLALLTGSSTAFEQVYQVAQRVGVAVGDVGSSFRRLALVKDDIGLTTREVAALTQTVLQLGRISGAGPQELAAGTQQLTQALASGKLQGDELRSVLENIPALAQVIARGLGVSVGALRQMGEEGKLTSDIVANVLGAAAESVNERFRQLPETLEQGNARAANAWNGLLADLDRIFNASGLLRSTKGWLTSVIEGARVALGSQDQALLRARGLTADQQLDAAKEDVGLTKAELDRLRAENKPNLFGVGSNDAAIAAAEARLRGLEQRLPALASELGRISGAARSEAEAEALKVFEARTAKTRSALAAIGDDLDKAMKPLATPAEKVAEINRQLEETRKKLAALRAAPGADQAGIDGQLARAEEVAARRRTDVMASSAKEATAQAKRASDELRQAAAQDMKVLDDLAKRELRVDDPRAAFVQDQLGRLSERASPALRDDVGRRAGELFDDREAAKAAERAARDEAELRRATELLQLQQQLGEARASYDRGEIDQTALDAEERRVELLRQGVDLESQQARLYLDQAARTDAQTARQREQAASMQELKHYTDQASAAIFDGLEEGIRSGESFSDVLKQIAKDLALLAVRAAFLDPAAAGTSSGLMGLLTSAGSALFGGGVTQAKGGAWDGGRPVPFAAGGVVSSPTQFSMAGGRRGLMGEAGPEAIMPLTRLGNGRLGVQAAGNGAGAPDRNSVTTINVDARGLDQGAMDMRIEAAIRRALPALQAQMVATAERSWR